MQYHALNSIAENSCTDKLSAVVIENNYPPPPPIIVEFFTF